MKRSSWISSWIWFAGCAAWLVDGFLSLHLHAVQRAELAFMVAMLFFVAGLFFRQQSR